MRVNRGSVLAAVPVLLAGALVFAYGCSSKPSADECDQLVRHLIDLEAAEAVGGAVPAEPKAELEQRKKAVFQSVGTSYCRDEMSVGQVQCALGARTLGELSQKCDGS